MDSQPDRRPARFSRLVARNAVKRAAKPAGSLVEADRHAAQPSAGGQSPASRLNATRLSARQPFWRTLVDRGPCHLRGSTFHHMLGAGIGAPARTEPSVSLIRGIRLRAEGRRRREQRKRLRRRPARSLTSNSTRAGCDTVYDPLHRPDRRQLQAATGLEQQTPRGGGGMAGPSCRCAASKSKRGGQPQNPVFSVRTT